MERDQSWETFKYLNSPAWRHEVHSWTCPPASLHLWVPTLLLLFLILFFCSWASWLFPLCSFRALQRSDVWPQFAAELLCGKWTQTKEAVSVSLCDGISWMTVCSYTWSEAGEWHTSTCDRTKTELFNESPSLLFPLHFPISRQHLLARRWRPSSCLPCLCTPGSPPRCSGWSWGSRPSFSPPSITPCCCSWPGPAPSSASAPPSSSRASASPSTYSIWPWHSPSCSFWLWWRLGRLYKPEADSSFSFSGACNEDNFSLPCPSPAPPLSTVIIQQTHHNFSQNLCLNWISARPCDLNEGENISFQPLST